MYRAFLPLALAGCFATDAPTDPPTSSHVLHLEVPLAPSPKVDMLFVVDRSPAMAPYVANLAANLPRMIEAIDTYGALPSVHIGVVGADGAALETRPSIAGDFIVDTRLTDGNRLRNYDGRLAEVLPALVDPRADRGPARPLEAMHAALTSHPTFRRRDAHLLVVLLTATDDASGDPLAHAAQLVDLAPNRVAIAAALPRGECGAAPQLERFLEQFEYHAHARAICESDLSDLLAFVNIKTTLGGPPCVPRIVDESPETARYEPACAVELAVGDGGTDVLPACTDGVAPCWKLQEEPQFCPFEEERYAFLVQRALADEMPFETLLRADCLVDR